MDDPSVVPTDPGDPVDFTVPEGHEGITVAFGTDVPHMPRWGKPMLYGPGSILDAHTDHERVSKRELAEAAAEYERAVRWSLDVDPLELY